VNDKKVDEIQLQTGPSSSVADLLLVSELKHPRPSPPQY
jgi:hypothetical protein